MSYQLTNKDLPREENLNAGFELMEGELKSFCKFSLCSGVQLFSKVKSISDFFFLSCVVDDGSDDDSNDKPTSDDDDCDNNSTSSEEAPTGSDSQVVNSFEAIEAWCIARVASLPWVPHTRFPQYSKLPLELRTMVIKLSLPPPAIIRKASPVLKWSVS